MSEAGDFHCPNCGFQVFNRRFPRCESCGAALPPVLLYTKQEEQASDAEYERNRKAVDELNQKPKDDAGGGWFSISDSSGFGGDCGGGGDGAS